MASQQRILLIILSATVVSFVSSFQAVDRHASVARHAKSRPRRTDSIEGRSRRSIVVVAATDDKIMSDVDEYLNPVTEILSNFMQKDDDGGGGGADKIDPLAGIDFGAPKISKLPIETLAAALDAELYEKEWFVTGNVNPIYFDDAFQFQDPDVKLTGIEEYARGVTKIFDQASSRAEIISCVVNDDGVPNTITVTWRLSGRVNITPKGLPIKPYICYTDFTVSEDSGLVVFQEDRFDVPGWDILLSALFPFLIGKVTKEAAPEVEPRVVVMPKMSGAKKVGIFDGVLQQLGL